MRVAAFCFVALGAVSVVPLRGEDVASPREEAEGPTAWSPADLVRCPEEFLVDPAARESARIGLGVKEVGGELIEVSLFDLPHQGGRCALQTRPALALLEPAQAASVLGMRSEVDAESFEGPKAFCSPRAQVFQVYPGRCGSSSTPIASAYAGTSQLMITSGQALGANTSVCLKSSFGSDTYYDVHEIRRTNAGLQQVAGLSLMRPVEGSVGWQVVTGSLADLSASGLQVDGLSGGAMPSCQEGLVSAFDTNFAEFFWRDYTPPFDPGFFNLGGPAYVRAAALQNPAGVHVDYRIVQGQFSNSAYPRFERFGFADSNTLSAWAGSAAPPPGQAVQILSPASGQLVDSGPPIVVALQNGDGVALEFDGQPTGNPIVNPADGWHTLVAYKTAAPQFRHTVRFRTRRISDAYEDDDTRETFRALFEGVPQQHNFSEPMDNDWVAFAVTSGTRSRVRLTGGVAAKAALTLYRQDEYPAGPITQVASASGTPNQLEVVDDSPFGFPFVVYYAWSRPTSASTFGPGTEHTLAVTVEVPPDAFEPDNEQSAYTALFEGVPQNHNFHDAGDEDWVAYAVGPGVVSRVTLEGAAASGAEITMYRHVNYPDGPVVQVSSSSNAAGTLLMVEHPSPPGEPISVYYVRARPTLETALRSNFVLAVSVD